ncbi:MAG: DNA polymerase III subunit gamma/tau [Candidatus Pacebacteria bacterium]|nr:DNA polymerase III subunit gamma/tau [Candidatus Paceibacterota bacterium]
MPALYRKYRPRAFRDLVGQSQIKEIFANAGRQDKLAHAYVFYGSRGTGKTTVARLVAKLANCTARDYVHKEGEPCNACVACAAIDEGRALDVVEIDAASNRGIDEIRDLRESIRVAPSSFIYKVFIIDEAHMLTGPAWNALLKTLEEPPPRTIIILATTEYEKIPATIASRAQRFHFRKIPMRELVGKLNEIVAAEKFTITPEAIELIAAASEGGMRDAQSLLDQAASTGAAVDLATVESLVGKVGFRRIAQFADAVAKGDASDALRALHEVRSVGGNVLDVCKELIAYLRRTLALRTDPKLEELFKDELTKEELAATIAHSKSIDPLRAIALLKALIAGYGEMRYSPFPHIPLEVAFIEHLGKSK